jgi:hypothetical protein
MRSLIRGLQRNKALPEISPREKQKEEPPLLDLQSRLGKGESSTALEEVVL